MNLLDIITILSFYLVTVLFNSQAVILTHKGIRSELFEEANPILAMMMFRNKGKDTKVSLSAHILFNVSVLSILTVIVVLMYVHIGFSLLLYSVSYAIPLLVGCAIDFAHDYFLLRHAQVPHLHLHLY